MSDLHDPNREIKLDDSDELAARVFALEAQNDQLMEEVVNARAGRDAAERALNAIKTNLNLERRERQREREAMASLTERKLSEQRIAHHEEIRRLETERDVASGKLHEKIAHLEAQLRMADRTAARIEKRIEEVGPLIDELRQKADKWDQVAAQLAGDGEDGDAYTEILQRILAEHTGRTEVLQKALDLLLPFAPKDFAYDPVHPEWFVEDLLRKLIDQHESARKWIFSVEREIISLHCRLLPHWEFVDPLTTLDQIGRRFEGLIASYQRADADRERMRSEASWDRENRRIYQDQARLRGQEHMGG